MLSSTFELGLKDLNTLVVYKEFLQKDSLCSVETESIVEQFYQIRE